MSKLAQYGLPICQPKGGKPCIQPNGPKFNVNDIVQVIKASNKDYELEIGRYGPIKGIEEGLLSINYLVDLYRGTPYKGAMTSINEADLVLFNILSPQVKPPPPNSVQHETEYKVCFYGLLPNNRHLDSCEYYTKEEQELILNAYENKEPLFFFKNNWEKEGELERHTFNFVYDGIPPSNKNNILIRVPK